MTSQAAAQGPASHGSTPCGQSSAAGRLLDSYWQDPDTEDELGEGKKEEKPILFPGEKRLLLTAVHRKAEVRAHVI